MRKDRIDCTGWVSKEEAQRGLAQALHFPAWYGKNLDAMYDLLSEQEGWQITLQNTLSAQEKLGNYWKALIQVMKDAGVTVIIEKGHLIHGVEELIGHTPLLEAARFASAAGIGNGSRILVKLERQNPAGSSKDRIALKMIVSAEEKGLLQRGGTIVEPTSGNTGIGLASVAAARGYKAVFTMPDTMSVERRMLLTAYGASVVLTPGKDGMKGAIQKAKEIAGQMGAFLPGQFENPNNPQAHYETTGPEIWSDAGGEIDAFTAGVGTGGTLSGVGRYLKEQRGDICIIAVEPKNSPVLKTGKGGPHGLMGIGAGFVPDTLDTSIYDELFEAEENASYEAARLFAQSEGILIGITGGAALCAAMDYARREAGKTVVALLPDSGERYLSTPLYQK